MLSSGIGTMKSLGKYEMKKKEAPVQQDKEEQLPKVVGVIPADIESKFEFYNFGHALEILTQSCKVEWADFLESLRSFSIPIEDIMAAGGNESPIPKRLDELLYPRGWREIRITGDLLIKLFPRRSDSKRGHFSEKPLTNGRYRVSSTGTTLTL